MPEITTPNPVTSGLSDRAPQTERVMSVDALRGFDMFWILGADSLVYALNRMSPSRPTQFLATQLEHADWEGFHVYDLIFPLFVFLAGVSLVFSLGRLLERGGRAEALKRVFRRSILLFILALIYSGGASNAWPDIRLMGEIMDAAVIGHEGGNHGGGLVTGGIVVDPDGEVRVGLRQYAADGPRQ